VVQGRRERDVAERRAAYPEDDEVIEATGDP